MTYAKQVAPEYQEDDLFWTDKNNNLRMNDEWFEENVIIVGNKEFKEFLTRDYEKLIGLDWWEYENFKNYGFACVTDYLNYYLPRKDGKSWSGPQVAAWKRIIKDEDWEEGLRLLTGLVWRSVTIRGCMQREWQEMLVSENISDAQVNYIEMCYFNTGMEFLVYEDDSEDSAYSVYVRDEDELKECCGVDKVYLFDGWENSDILGWVTGWKRKIEDVRLFRFATKKAWENSRRMWVDAITLA